MLLTREQILSQKLPTKTIKVPWIEGGEIMLRAIPAWVQNRSMQDKEITDPDALVFVHAVIDQDGNRIYKDEDADLIANEVDTALIRLVAFESIRMSEISEEKKEAIKKNYPAMAGALFGESPSRSDTPTPT